MTAPTGQEPGTVRQELCPFCATIITDITRSDDHVFTQALGGRAKVPACRTCNSTLGRDVEGQLLRNDTVLNFLRQTHGIGGLPTKGVLSDRSNVHHDLITGEIRHQNPVQVETTPIATTYRYTGSRRQVEDLLRKDRRLTSAHITKLLAGAVEVPVTEPIQTTIIFDVDLATRLAAKAALGAARIAAGPAYDSTPLAAKLRDVLWSRTKPATPGFTVETLQILDKTLYKTLGSAHVPLAPPPQASQVVFVPRPAERTWIFTWLLDFQLPVLDVDAVATFAHHLPVAVRDHIGGPEILSVYDELLAFAKTVGDTAKTSTNE